MTTERKYYEEPTREAPEELGYLVECGLNEVEFDELTDAVLGARLMAAELAGEDHAATNSVESVEATIYLKLNVHGEVQYQELKTISYAYSEYKVEVK